MTNADIARVFRNIAVMLELEGANPFRIRAYQEAARVVETLGEPLAAIAGRERGLEELRGIGKDLAGKIRDLLATGRTQVYEELKGRYPESLLGLTEVQGLGAKRVKLLFDTLGIRDRAGLETAAREGRLHALPGFGMKIEQNILKSIASVEQWAGRVLLSQAWALAGTLVEELRRIPGVTRAEAAGSFRRRRDTVGDLDLLVSGGDGDQVMDRFVALAPGGEVIGRGATKCSVRIAMGLQVDLRHVPEPGFGAALLYFTGSKGHNIELRKLALERRWMLNEYGLYEGERMVAGRTEEEVYRALDLPWIAPELREGVGEIALGRAGRLPKLIELEDLQGDLHMHTTRTDGRASLAAMIAACRARDYAYCAITEHSKSVTMARGFDEARVRQSADELAAARRQAKDIHVLHGLEVDIMPDGTLDLADDGLALLDWVNVSIHRGFDQSEAEMTARVLGALAHPRVCAMSHPTGRKIGQRPGVALDLDRVFTRAAELGVAMEINAQPDRTDLCDTHARRAAELGVKLVISTDAHSETDLDMMRWGVFAARRAGLTKEHVLNTLPLEALLARTRAAKSPARATRSRETSRPARPVQRRGGSAPAKDRAATKSTGTARRAPAASARSRRAAAPKPRARRKPAR
jgi:DNA polymerase (family X)